MGPAGATSGTGVFFRTDGFLLTSADAVDGATTIQVVLHDGQAEAGQLVGVDTENDVAVVKVERADLASATIGQPTGLQMGENTIVISFTERPDAPIIGEGLVSGLGQKVKHEDGAMHGLIQTSVRLHTDATGSPLIDSSGSVVGIVTRRGTSPEATRPSGNVTSGGTADGAEVWFATPIDWAKHLADQLVTHGRVVDEVAMGVTGSDLDAEKQEDLGRGAAAVREVVDASAAEQAGLEPGDLITAIDGAAVTDWSDLIVAIRLRRPGDIVSVTYHRGNEENVALVTLQAQPPD
jgi:S1-C subfamily serine protease